MFDSVVESVTVLNKPQQQFHSHYMNETTYCTCIYNSGTNKVENWYIRHN